MIHSSAIVEDGAAIDPSANVWHFAHIRSGSVIESKVSLGKGVYVDCHVKISEGSRVQNEVSIYNGVSIGKWCFVGPRVVFTNDMYPRSGVKHWDIIPTKIDDGVSIGAGAVIICGIELMPFCMVGAGSIATESIQPFTLAYGAPARPKNYICACGSTKFDLSSRPISFVLDCCKTRLSSEVLNLGIFYSDRLRNV
ncbi:MAG: N-acetyltransferase [Deltaproteobacteria bacterium]|nr:N-acetyltransferase [Deltaproteobacteria bacterium]